MSYQTCFKCGKVLPVGGLKYIVSINILADFEGVLLEPSGNIDEEIEKLIKELKNRDPEAIEKDVHQRMAFQLCKSCKDQFAKDPLGISKESFIATKDKIPGMMH
jgi:hypothetical protein